MQKFDEGSQGAVYSVQFGLNKKPRILKVYHQSDLEDFENEVRILKVLNNVNGFPKMISAKRGHATCEIVMQ